ncbi:c-type cytochrome [Indioceanicola profundi]|uniref:c-type cytochrome n=1 Tax=Indioceanicola profundi TaxID=2220096 RepID=UPI000E6AA47A|nr:cytochrome c [Indioceanicola profundi]
MRSRLTLAAAAAALCLSCLPAMAQSTDAQSNAFATADRFSYQDGEALYRAICQGCHMPDGKGAEGAGIYPSLASNPNLEAGDYPIYMVVNGRKAMPSFEGLSDAQVAAVVNFIRTHFGNGYTDPVTPEDVTSTRPAE